MSSVCILTSAHPAFDTRIFHKQAVSLRQAGYEVTLISHHPESTTRDGIEIEALPPVDTHWDRFVDLWDLYKSAIKKDADVYHLHDPGLLPVGVGLSARTDAKIIYDVHEQYEKAFQYYDFPPDFITPAFVKFYPRFQSLCCMKFDGVITTNLSTTKQFRQAGHQNVVAIHNYPITDKIKIGKADVESTADFILAYVGSMGPIRGLKQMLNCTHKLCDQGYDVELWLLGDLGQYKEMVISHTERHNIKDNIRLFGYVDYSEIFSYLQNADVGLVFLDPNYIQHDIPTKLFEYMYVNLPVVVTRTESTERIVDRSFGRLTEFNDIDDQARVIGDLLDNPEQRRSMGKYGQELVEKRYNWEHEEDRLISFYNMIINS